MNRGYIMLSRSLEVDEISDEVIPTYQENDACVDRSQEKGRVDTEVSRRQEPDDKKRKFEELEGKDYDIPATNSSRPQENLEQNTRLFTEQRKNIRSQPNFLENDLHDKHPQQEIKSVSARVQFDENETRRLSASSNEQDERIDQKKFRINETTKAAMFERQYKVWEAERKPFLDNLLHEILALELTIFWLGWNESLVTYFLPYYFGSHFLISLITQLTVPMFHNEGVVMRKLNVMTLFHFITLVIVSSSIILWCISSYGNFYVVNDVAAAHSSMKVLKLDIEDACEAACARKKTCVMYQYAGSECSLYNTTLEQAGLGALDVSGSTLALKKIVKSSKHESDGQLYYVSDLVSTSANCTRCRDICGGHFHVANLPRSSPVLKQIVQRGDALNHPLLYEVGGFVPFCWNSDNGQNCKHGILVSRALDAARLRVYHRGKDLSYVKRKFVKVLCQSNPLGRKKISKIKIVYELKDMCKGWFNSIVCSCPMFWMMATEVNELWFELKNELSEVLGDWYSSVEDYFREVYLEIIAWMEAEE